MSLNSHSLGYRITGKDVGFSLETGLSALPYAERHFELGSKSTGSVSSLHYTVGTLECLPGGFLIGLIDRIVGWTTSFFQNNEEQQITLFEQFPETTIQLINSYLLVMERAYFSLVNKRTHRIVVLNPKEILNLNCRLTLSLIWRDHFRTRPYVNPPADEEKRLVLFKRVISKVPNNVINVGTPLTYLGAAIKYIDSDELCLKTVKVLFDKGANPLQRTTGGIGQQSFHNPLKLPIDLARERNFPELVELIESKMSAL